MRAGSRLRPGVAAALAIGLLIAARGACAADGRGLLDPPALPTGTVMPGTGPWIDAQGTDHRQRDAERRARDGSAGSPGTLPPPAEADPAQAEALRRQGERERDARGRRGGLAPPPEATPRIQPDAPPSPAMPAPPRIPIPQPGEPGGPPIALPTCGPAGCFDANGRALPDAGGGLLIGPGGRPCVRIGNAVTC